MFRFWRSWFVLGLLSLGASCASAQTVSPAAPPMPTASSSNPELTAEQIQSRLKQVEEAKELEESVRLSLMETYKKALQYLKTGDEFAAKTAELVSSVQSAPDRLKQIKSELANATPETTLDIPSDMTLAQMQQSLTQAETRLAETQKTMADLQAEPKRRADRRVEIPKQQDAARKVLQEIETEMGVKPSADELAEVTQANRLLLQARKRAVTLELQYYDQELRAYEALGELLTARRDLAVIQAAQAEQAVKLWRAAVSERRRVEAEQQALEAKRAALRAHPAINRLAKESADLTVQRQQLAESIERVTKDTDDLEKKLQELDAQFVKVLNRVKRVGLTEAIGLQLRKLREDLPNVGEHRHAIENRQAEISKTNLSLVELEDRRSLLADIDAQTKVVISEIQDSVNELELPLIEEDVRQALMVQRGYLDSLITDTNSYLDRLVELDTRERQLISKIEEFAAFSSEHVLWIRSAALPRVSDARAYLQAVNWLCNVSHWHNVGMTLWQDAISTPIMYSLALLLLLLFVSSRRTWRRRLQEVGEEAARSRATSFGPTAKALILTGLLAITWPAAMWLLGMRLSVAGVGNEFVTAVGQALQGSAALLLLLELTREISRTEGLGEAHFGWPRGDLQHIRRCSRGVMALGLPTAMVVMMTEAQTSEPFKNTLGRSAFLVAQGLLVFYAYRISSVASREGDQWWLRVRRFWQIVAIGGSVTFAMMAVVGYYFTAVQLERRLILSMGVTFFTLIIHATLVRWMLLAYRDLAWRRMRERRAAMVAASSGSTVPAEVAIPEPVVTLTDINLQTRKLLRIAVFAALLIGFWLIWVEVLPALKVFRRVVLWPNPFRILDAMTPPAAGTLTLGDGILALVIAWVTFAASRNVPGLLEVTVLRRLTLDAGARYAVTAVSKYIITVIGVVVAFGQLGIGWSQVQWLVAAVSVGLGFGLQEIFANFVSGLVLLFERPIRIGDIVSVGDVTGKVSRIRIRATTITDWDLRELVVPNKEFITGRVMNWTLSDTVSRMTIQVGVAYGTDPELTKQTLLKVAAAHPLVLKEPPPHALFDAFGDSTLNFTLRVYMASRDSYLELRHDLHKGIDAAFREAGIEIAFPQRDLHIRSMPPNPSQSVPVQNP